MISEKDFSIPFSGLKLGTHSFNFNISDSFFTLFDYSDLYSAKIKVDVLLNKKANLLSLDIQINGNIKLNCDRCTEDYWQAIDQRFDLLVKFSDWQEESTDDDIIVLSSNEHTLSLTHSIYEFINLSLPSKREHSSIDECNPEMIETISQYIGIENDNEIEEIDPRWAALKNIKN